MLTDIEEHEKPEVPLIDNIRPYQDRRNYEKNKKEPKQSVTTALGNFHGP